MASSSIAPNESDGAPHTEAMASQSIALEESNGSMHTEGPSMTTVGIPSYSTPSKRTAVDTPSDSTPSKQQRLTTGPPKVATWVVVCLDQRKKINKNKFAVPCIICHVDTEDGSVRVLYPNALSHHFHKTQDSYPLSFVIEQHPLSRVKPYDGRTDGLNDILVQALLHFADCRAQGLRLGSIVKPAECGTPPVHISSSGAILDSAVSQADKLKAVLLMSIGNDGTSHANSPSHVRRNRSTAPNTSQTLSKKDELQTFTRRLAELFTRRGINQISEAILPKDAVERELAGEFPKWAAMLKQLVQANKIFEAGGEVFLV